MVNGPEDLPPETDLDTGRLGLGRRSDCEWEVQRLRQRIFKVTRAGDHSQPARPRGLLEPYAATSGTYGCMSHARLC